MERRQRESFTWRHADERAVGQGVAAVEFEVDGDGAEDGLQVLLLLQTAGGLRGRGGSYRQGAGPSLHTQIPNATQTQPLGL